MERRHVLPPGCAGRAGREVVTRTWILNRFAENGFGPDGVTLIGGDHDLNPGTRFQGILKPAAVLVPLVDRPEGMTILLTRRTQHLADHAGQVAFPGGRAEDFDAGPEATALREAQEEIGLDPERVELLGRLGLYETVTGYSVVPVVGIVRPPFAIAADPFEVAEVFEVPLTFFLDPANLERHRRATPHGERSYFVWPFEDHYIWGATAGMLVNLSEILRR